MQRPTQRIISPNPSLRLTTPFGQHDLLVRTVSHFDNDTTIVGSGLDLTKRYVSGHLTDISSRPPIVLIETRSLFVLPCWMDDDQIIDPIAARALQTDVARTHALSGWVILRDPPDFPGRFMARLVTSARHTNYVLMADSLAELQAMLPPDLVRSERQPTEPPEVVEIWFAA